MCIKKFQGVVYYILISLKLCLVVYNVIISCNMHYSDDAICFAKVA